MMRKATVGLFGLTAAAIAAGPVFAAAPVPFANTLYSSDFETDQSGVWTTDTNPGPGAGNHSLDHNFAFTNLDGRTGTGIKIVANTGASAGASTQQTTLDLNALTGGVISQITGSYQLEVDIWMNYSQAGPGAGTSEYAYIGVNTTPGVSPSYQSGYINSGTYLISTVDGDITSDITVRDSSAPADGLTTITDPSHNDAAYALDVPATSIGNGAIINGWATWTLQYNAGTDTFNVWIDDLQLDFFDTTTFELLDKEIPNNSGVTSGSVSLGALDALANSSAFPLDQWVIFDNVLVTTENDLLAGGLEGDLNGDGFVGIADLNIVLGAWNQNVAAGNPLLGDPSGDGFVGIADLNSVLGNWNAGTPPTAAAAVPEPATLSLIALGGLAMIRRTHRS